jgi:hypothetical protein
MIDYINGTGILSERPWHPDDCTECGEPREHALHDMQLIAEESGTFTIEDVDVPYIEDVAPNLPCDDVTVTWDKTGRRHMGFPVSAATRQKISAARKRGHAVRTLRMLIREAQIDRIVALVAEL